MHKDGPSLASDFHTHNNDLHAEMNLPVSPICASAFGCGTLYHVRNADSRHQELISLLRSTVPLKYLTSVSPESVNITHVRQVSDSFYHKFIHTGRNNSHKFAFGNWFNR